MVCGWFFSLHSAFLIIYYQRVDLCAPTHWLSEVVADSCSYPMTCPANAPLSKLRTQPWSKGIVRHEDRGLSIYCPALLHTQLALCLRTPGEEGSSQLPAATPVPIIFHLSSSTADWPRRRIRNFRESKGTPPLPCLWGLVCVLNGADLFRPVKPSRRGHVSLPRVPASCISCSNPCLVCGFEMIMSCCFSSLVCRSLFLTD